MSYYLDAEESEEFLKLMKEAEKRELTETEKEILRAIK